jgi:hypothetical protein
MDASDDIRIKYASKYDESSNYWKNSIGTNRSLRRLNVLERKRTLERDLQDWIRRTPAERDSLLHLLTDLELAYKDRRAVNRAQAYLLESFLNGPELVQLALSILNFDFGADPKVVEVSLQGIVDKYANLDLDVDKDVFTALLKEYPRHVEVDYLPSLYDSIATVYGGSERAYVDSLYARTAIATPRGLKRFLENDTTLHLFSDPAISLGIDLITQLFEMNMQMNAANLAVDRGERLFNAAVRRYYADRRFYPDANSTMRLSFGTVRGYDPADGTHYRYFTTVRGILEKAREHRSEPDFALQPELVSLLESGDYGRYADRSGEMKVCFISDNDITGGNSGSAMFNARGQLLGLAFDGNWEAMSSDYLYEPRLQRCIGVDIRYVLFIIEKYGQAGRLIEELKIG